MIRSGAFIAYPESLLALLFEARGVKDIYTVQGEKRE
jgi:hypothetical protein